MSTGRGDPPARLARPDPRDVRRRRLRDRDRPARARSRRRPRGQRARSRRPVGALRPVPGRDGRGPRHRRAPHRRSSPTSSTTAATATSPRTVDACRAVLRPDAVDGRCVTTRSSTDRSADRRAAVDVDEFAAAARRPRRPGARSASTITTDDGLIAALDAAGTGVTTSAWKGTDVSENATMTTPPDSDTGGVLLDLVAATDYLSRDPSARPHGVGGRRGSVALVGHRPGHAAR